MTKLIEDNHEFENNRRNEIHFIEQEEFNQNSNITMKLVETVKSFFNTTVETPTVVAERIEKALNQEERILAEYKRIKQATSATKVALSAGALYYKPFEQGTPITSIRRALNQLERKGELYRNGEKVQGLFKASEFLYFKR